MWLALNELSFHGQFTSAGEVYDTIERLMSLRALARRGGQTIRLPRGLFDRQAVGARPLKDVVLAWPDRNKREALKSWAQREGPFALDDRQHTGDEFLVLEAAPDDPITDTALAEAAWRKLKTGDAEVVSASPSALTQSPLRLLWRPDDVARAPIELNNHTAQPTLLNALSGVIPLDSWAALERHARLRFDALTFCDNAFHPLQAEPFHLGIAEDVLERLRVLDEVKRLTVPGHGLSASGVLLWQTHSVGDKAWFTDSSDSEKVVFKSELTFLNPKTGARQLVGWHGKVKNRQIRLHFSHPINHADPLIIFYVGPKLTKR
ncbi:hypothetical protein L6R46_16700 [Myxococcota bacterium]|jgi:hypothetical protein|nr:hypothetical protein [Myxococcota bacterium]